MSSRQRQEKLDGPLTPTGRTVLQDMQTTFLGPVWWELNRIKGPYKENIEQDMIEYVS